MNEIERVERISEGGATQRPRRIAKSTTTRGIETRTGTGVEAGTGVVVIPTNGLFEVKKFEII